MARTLEKPWRPLYKYFAGVGVKERVIECMARFYSSFVFFFIADLWGTNKYKRGKRQGCGSPVQLRPWLQPHPEFRVSGCRV